MNPLDMTGPEFLVLYVVLLAGAIALAAALRRGMRSPHDGPDIEAVDLDPYEAAYLAGGERLAADAAIASLVQRRAVAVDTAARAIAAPEPVPSRLHALERAVAPASQDGETTRTIAAARKAARPQLEGTRQRLLMLGLLVDDGTAWAARLLPVVPIVLVLLLGLAKLRVGWARDKPTDYLMGLTFITAIIGAGFLQNRPHRSRWGDAVLEDLRRRNAALRVTGSRRAAELSGQDLALAMALFGIGVLVGGPLDDLRTALAPPSGSSDGGGGDGGGGGCGG